MALPLKIEKLITSLSLAAEVEPPRSEVQAESLADRMERVFHAGRFLHLESKRRAVGGTRTGDFAASRVQGVSRSEP